MSVTAEKPDGEAELIKRADDHLLRARDHVDRRNLRAAKDEIQKASQTIELVEHFRDAKRGRA